MNDQANNVIRVEEVMHTDFHVVDGTDTVATAIQLMKETNKHELIINKRNDDDEYGYVQLSDIAKKVLAQDRSPSRVNLYEIMAKPVIHVRPTMDIKYCARLFENFGLSAAPVMKNSLVVGVVTYKDIVLKGLLV